MDKSLRTAIYNTVVQCRRLLERDLARQLEGACGVHADGAFEPLESLTHLDAVGRADREAIEAAVRHDQVAGMDRRAVVEREIERQQRIVAKVAEFRDRLDRVALLNIPPDPNDGVVISIAPLWELVPWKEAQRTWEKLIAGEYPWSAMAQQMRERGLVKPKA